MLATFLPDCVQLGEEASYCNFEGKQLYPLTPPLPGIKHLQGVEPEHEGCTKVGGGLSTKTIVLFAKETQCDARCRNYGGHSASDSNSTSNWIQQGDGLFLPVYLVSQN